MSDGERALRLCLHGEPVAVLVERGARPPHTYELVFERSWGERIERPVLSLGALNWRLPVPRSFSGRLPPFLTNLLPERDGAMRRRIARAAGLVEQDDVAFLRFVGHDMSGAITVEDADAPAPSARVIEDGGAYPAEARRLRASFGGVQPKFSVDRHDRLTVLARGKRGRWLLKVPDAARLDLARAEYATMEWARRVGFEVPALEIIDPREVENIPPDAVNGIPEALLVRRFDRTDAYDPIHMEEVASALGMHPEEKYAEPVTSHPEYHLVHVGRIVRRFTGEAGLMTFLRRIILDLMVGNGDAHLKNWAFLFPDRRNAVLAPAYDIVPTFLYGDEKSLALRLVGSRTLRSGHMPFNSIELRQVRLFAQKVGVSPDACERAARETVEAAADTFEDAMSFAGFPDPRRRELREHWESLPLVRDARRG